MRNTQEACFQTLRRLNNMSNPTTSESRDAAQMISVGTHTGFSYEAIRASEQSQVHMGNVYNFNYVNYCNAHCCPL